MRRMRPRKEALASVEVLAVFSRTCLAWWGWKPVARRGQADRPRAPAPGRTKVRCQHTEGNTMANISEEVRRISPAITAIRRDLHQHPELGFHEVRTAGIVA